MAQVHMTEAEVARDLTAVLEKVRQGAEVIVERDSQPVAVIRSPSFRGRPIDECIALARKRGSDATLDEKFAEDLKSIINSHLGPAELGLLAKRLAAASNPAEAAEIRKRLTQGFYGI
jgi:antitoxin (DNA-binding transcriptional repressor) of toxin-antitoxin stability system